MIIKEENYLMHYGIIRRSGRYPWGSGEDPFQRSVSFFKYVDGMKAQGLTDSEIAKGIGASSEEYAEMTLKDIRAARSMASNERRAGQIAQAQALKDKSWSNVAISKRMGIPESTVRNLLRPGEADKQSKLRTVTKALMSEVEKHGYIDVGAGVEHHLGISSTLLENAVGVARAEGLAYHKIQVPQQHTGNMTTVKVLAPEGTEYLDVKLNPDKIVVPHVYSEDNGKTMMNIYPPKSIDSKRVQVVYSEQGGSDRDGMMYVRPGVDDVSLGGNRYAQVRVAVDGTHYLKGMATYKDDLPDGVDVQFHTNKSDSGNKLDAMKGMKTTLEGNIDTENPFGSFIHRQITETDKDGKVAPTSVMNIVNEDATWGNWSKNLSSQLLSKQTPKLAQDQLNIVFNQRKEELDTIRAYTNPVVRKTLLASYADDVDSAAVEMAAAALPNQSTHVILPINSLKDNEVYAPNYKDGTPVVLIRYPHGGRFEIPELVVNNRNREARKTIGTDARAAVGINSTVAARLSGADFDGDTVVVIPNIGKKIKSAPALEGLKDFDPQSAYPGYEGMKVMGDTQKQMGVVSNLITDMTLKGANDNELARAVRHSMVVIDAEKHGLNYKLSAERNGIKQLAEKYQGTPQGKASTLISRASGPEWGPDRPLRKASEGGPIDPKTGKLVYGDPRGYTNKEGVFVPKVTKVKRLSRIDDAHTLSSGTKMEGIYADHSNRLKDLANQARKDTLSVPKLVRSPSAARVYAEEVATLTSKLKVAERNAPLERQAQIIAGGTMSILKASYPDLDASDLKKHASLALNQARDRLGARKEKIVITPSEWNAIQAGAVSESRLTDILKHADMDVVKKYATPRDKPSMGTAQISRANSMRSAGYTWAEIAAALGISVSTIKSSLE